MKKLASYSLNRVETIQIWFERLKPGLIALTVIICAFLISTYVGKASSLTQMVYPVGAVLAIGGLILLLRMPQLGFVLLILSGMFIGYSGPGGINATALVVGLLFGVWLLDGIIIRKSFRLIKTRTILSIFIFILLAFLSFVVGQLPWFLFARQAPLDAQVGGLLLYVLSALTFLLASHLISDLNGLKWITWSFIISGAIYVVLGRFVYRVILGSPVLADFYQPGSTGSLFWTWLTALSLGQALFNNRLHKFWRFALGIFIFLIFYIAYFQAGGWKSGWVPPLFAVFAILAIRYWRKMILLLPAIPIAGIIFFRQIVETDVYSYSTRVEAWEIVLNIAKASPIFGLGFGNYYWYTPLFLIRGWSIQFNSHNQYVDIIAQMGILGLLVFIWFFGELGNVGAKLLKVAPDGFTRGYVYGTLGGIAGTLVASFFVDWALPFVYNIGFTGFRSSILAWLFMGGLISVQRLFDKKFQF